MEFIHSSVIQGLPLERKIPWVGGVSYFGVQSSKITNFQSLPSNLKVLGQVVYYTYSGENEVYIYDGANLVPLSNYKNLRFDTTDNLLFKDEERIWPPLNVDMPLFDYGGLNSSEIIPNSPLPNGSVAHDINSNEYFIKYEK